MEGAAFEDGRTPSIWDTFAHAGQLFFIKKKKKIIKRNLILISVAVFVFWKKEFNFLRLRFRVFGRRDWGRSM